MVQLGTLPPFQARLLAARLGAEGILWQLRGESSIYPFASVDVLVEESRLDSARDMLDVDVPEECSADEVAMAGALRPNRSRGSLQLMLWLVVLTMIMGLVLRVTHQG
jgi:hypothetical protein